MLPFAGAPFASLRASRAVRFAQHDAKSERAMLIRFTKRSDKDPVLTCVRDDGSVTWMKTSELFVLHDFIHYTIEATLGLRKSFFGLLAKGLDIQSFSVAAAAKTLNLPLEALQTECAAGWFQAEMTMDGLGMVTREPLILPGSEPPIEMPEKTRNLIRRRVRTLVDRWAVLPNGETLTLRFATDDALPVRSRSDGASTGVSEGVAQ